MAATDELRARFHQAVRDGNINAAEELARQLNSLPSQADAYIANITEETFGPVNQWHYMAPVTVQAKKPGEVCGLTRISPHTDHIDLGEGKTLPVLIAARDTAEDICRFFNSDIGSDSFAGLFVCAGDQPTKTEIHQARVKLEEFYRRLIAVADYEHERGLKVNISDLHRRAGRYFRLQKPWLTDYTPMMPCPVCMERIPEGAALCGKCGAVLDAEKVAAYKPREAVANSQLPVEETVSVPSSDEKTRLKSLRRK